MVVDTCRTDRVQSQGDVVLRTLMITANDRLRRPLFMHGDPAVEMHRPASPAYSVHHRLLSILPDIDPVKWNRKGGFQVVALLLQAFII